VKGRGFGHGVGMSQWGAYGLSRHGHTYKSILGHYYRHTTIGHHRNSEISVLLGSGGNSVSFKGATSACGKRLRRRQSYVFAASGSGVDLRKSGGGKVAGCGGAGTAAGGGTIRIGSFGLYRGKLRAKSSGGGLLVIN